MGHSLLIRILTCIGVFGVFLYSYIDKQNALTKQRLEIPKLAKQIKELKESSTRLKYEIDLFESPEHLMELARHSEYSHLRQPMLKEIMTLQLGLCLDGGNRDPEEKTISRPKRDSAFFYGSIPIEGIP